MKKSATWKKKSARDFRFENKNRKVGNGKLSDLDRNTSENVKNQLGRAEERCQRLEKAEEMLCSDFGMEARGRGMTTASKNPWVWIRYQM